MIGTDSVRAITVKPSDRRALHSALVPLVELGVLRERDGDLEHWVDHRTQSLLDVRRDLLGILVAAPLASTTTADELLEAAALPSAIGGARTATRRRLLETPVLSTDELPEDHADWWRRNRNRERDWYETRFGLDLELRAEGAAVVDRDDAFSDEHFPGRDKTRQLALLVLEAVADAARGDRPGPNSPPGHAGLSTRVNTSGVDPPGGAWRAIPYAVAEASAREVHRTWRDRLRRDQREDPDGAIRDALDVLARFALVRLDGDRVLVHAAAARYAPHVTLAETRSTGERSLFDDPTDDDGS